MRVRVNVGTSPARAYSPPPKFNPMRQKSEHELIMHFWKEKGKCIFTHWKKILLESAIIFVNRCFDRSLGIRGVENLPVLPRSIGERAGAGRRPEQQRAGSTAHAASVRWHRVLLPGSLSAAQDEQEEVLYLPVTMSIVMQSLCCYPSLVKMLCWVLAIHAQFFLFFHYS